ncbi:MAG TPA: WG repeat-containing protein [Crocinitomicaceae bacterium]|nr:WG repeat-containing protein [Crocinitomicaceae bacterium]
MWRNRLHSDKSDTENIPDIVKFTDLHDGNFPYPPEDCYTIMWEKGSKIRYVFDENLNFVGKTELYFFNEYEYDFKYFFKDQPQYCWAYKENLAEQLYPEEWEKCEIVYWSHVEPFEKSSNTILRENVDYKAKENNRHWLADKKLNIISDDYFCFFGEEWIAGEFLAVAKENEKYGYLDSNGKLILDYQFDGGNIDTWWMSHPNYDIVDVKNEFGDHVYGVVDWNGNLIIEPKYKEIYIHDELMYEFDRHNQEQCLLKKEKDYFELTDFDNSIVVWKYHSGFSTKTSI